MAPLTEYGGDSVEDELIGFEQIDVMARCLSAKLG